MKETTLQLIHKLKKTEVCIVVCYALGSICCLASLYKLVPSSYQNVAIVLMFGLVSIVISSAIYMMQSADRLHRMRLRIDREVGRFVDEAMHVQSLRAKLKEELGNAAIDNTVHGAFFYGRQKILANDFDVAHIRQDFDDREFDMTLIIKRKSTPLDEVLSAVHKAGML